MPIRSALLIVLGIVVFWDAKKRGYSIEYALLWGLGTAAFIPVVLVYLLWGRRRKKGKEKADDVPTEGAEEKAAVDVSQKVPCPRCASDVPESFSRCPYCGAALKPVCPDCGQPLSKKDAACPRRGAWGEKSADASPFAKS